MWKFHKTALDEFSFPVYLTPQTLIRSDPYEYTNTKEGYPMKKNTEHKNKKAINKGTLVSSVSDLSGLSKAESTLALEGLMESIKKGLKAGQDVRIHGLGTFHVATLKARMGHNPRTREPLKIKASKLPRFRASKTLKDAIA